MKAKILSAQPHSIHLCAQALLSGEVVAIPTETVYGLAGNIFDENALTKIFSVKERPTFDPLIVHISVPPSSHQKLTTYLNSLQLIDLSEFSQTALTHLETLAETFWPGPLTLVLPKHKKVPDLATSGLNTVAIRMPRHSMAQELIQKVGYPLAAPSANRFGRISPTQAEHVLSELGDRIPYILDGGPCQIGVESTVLALSADGICTLLRPGGTPVEFIEKALQQKVQSSSSHQIVGQLNPSAPGMLASHYAPRKPMLLLPSRVPQLTSEEVQEFMQRYPNFRKIGLLLFSGSPHSNEKFLKSISPSQLSFRVETLSQKGDPNESAKNLFSQMRKLDADPEVEIIWAEIKEDPIELEHAIVDRLKRASHK